MSPLLRGLAAALVVLVLGALLHRVFDWGDARGGPGPFWFGVLQAALIGYGVGLGGWLQSTARSALRDLRPALGDSARAAAEDPAALAVSPAARGAAALVGAALGVALAANPDAWPYGRPSQSFLLWTLARAAVIGSLAFDAAVLSGGLARRLSRLGGQVARVDLLDPRAFAPLTRYGLRTVGLWMGFSALFALMFLASFASVSAAVALTATGAFASLALLLPVGGARGRIRGARDAELARVRSEIRARLEGASAPPPLSLSDLLAWEARIRGVSSWPYDLGAWLRFAFYVTLGLGSWVGAALVERVLGAVLG